MMRRDRGRKDDRASSLLIPHLSSNGLSTEKRPREIDFVSAPPLIAGHFDGVCAADDTGETAEDVDGAEDLDCTFHGYCDCVLVADIDGLSHDACVRKFRMQALD